MNWPTPGDSNGKFRCVGWDYLENQVVVKCLSCSRHESFSLEQWSSAECTCRTIKGDWQVIGGDPKTKLEVKCIYCGHTRPMSGHQYRYFPPACSCQKVKGQIKTKPLIEGKAGKNGIIGNWIYVSKDRDGFTWTCKVCGRDTHTQTADVQAKGCMECYHDEVACAEPTENDLALWAAQPEIGEAIQASRLKRRERVASRQPNVSGTN